MPLTHCPLVLRHHCRQHSRHVLGHQASNSDNRLAQDGVTLLRHRARAALARHKRLLYFTELRLLQGCDLVGHLAQGGRQ